MTAPSSDSLTVRAKREYVVVVIGDGRGEPTVEQVNRVLAVLRNKLSGNPTHVVVTGGVAFSHPTDETSKSVGTLAAEITAALQALTLAEDVAA